MAVVSKVTALRSRSPGNQPKTEVGANGCCPHALPGLPLGNIRFDEKVLNVACANQSTFRGEL